MSDLSLNTYLKLQDDNAVKDAAIELLTSQFMMAFEASAKDIIDASGYYLSHTDTASSIDDEKLDELCRKMAEELINKSEHRVF